MCTPGPPNVMHSYCPSHSASPGASIKAILVARAITVAIIELRSLLGQEVRTFRKLWFRTYAPSRTCDMNIARHYAIPVLCMCICYASDVRGKTADAVTIYRDTYVSFRYPTSLYKKVEQPTDGATGDKLRFYNLSRRSNEISDAITVCGASMTLCAGSERQTSPYWIDANTHQLALYDTTATVIHRKTSDADVYEAFPLCPSTDKSGRSDAYGGECYVAVKTNGQQTVSLTYWLGSSLIARSGRVRLDAIDRARKILGSLVWIR